MEKSIPVLYQEKANCCGCGACMNICPRSAITMVEDECGFLYPEINESLCVCCQKCNMVCAFQNIGEKSVPRETYAAVSRSKEQAIQSASGGIFAAIASEYIRNDGVVFGAAFTENYGVAHQCVNNISDLLVLQGSKYVQSRIGDTYQQVKEQLFVGKKVLFSGTPCQIAGLKSYLGKEYDNLMTVDVICHGVPSEKMFLSYLQYMERKFKGKINFFTFRDKNVGWGINGKAIFENEKGKKKKVILWQSGSSYLYYFIKGWIYRENCYRCKYAGKNRPGDITLGDYWGIEKQHPEYLDSKSGWNENNGISVLIVNTENGKRLVESLSNIEIKPSSFEKAAFSNGQLRHPSAPGKREEILEIYRQGGWAALEERFQKKIGWIRYSSWIKSKLPVGLKRRLKRHLK